MIDHGKHTPLYLYFALESSLFWRALSDSACSVGKVLALRNFRINKSFREMLIPQRRDPTKS
jgi:hypothetical protein